MAFNKPLAHAGAFLTATLATAGAAFIAPVTAFAAPSSTKPAATAAANIPTVDQVDTQANRELAAKISMTYISILHRQWLDSGATVANATAAAPWTNETLMAILDKVPDNQLFVAVETMAELPPIGLDWVDSEEGPYKNGHLYADATRFDTDVYREVGEAGIERRGRGALFGGDGSANSVANPEPGSVWKAVCVNKILAAFKAKTPQESSMAALKRFSNNNMLNGNAKTLVEAIAARQNQLAQVTATSAANIPTVDQVDTQANRELAAKISMSYVSILRRQWLDSGATVADATAAAPWTNETLMAILDKVPDNQLFVAVETMAELPPIGHLMVHMGEDDYQRSLLMSGMGTRAEYDPWRTTGEAGVQQTGRAELFGNSCANSVANPEPGSVWKLETVPSIQCYYKRYPSHAKTIWDALNIYLEQRSGLGSNGIQIVTALRSIRNYQRNMASMRNQPIRTAPVLIP